MQSINIPEDSNVRTFSLSQLKPKSPTPPWSLTCHPFCTISRQSATSWMALFINMYGLLLNLHQVREIDENNGTLMDYFIKICHREQTKNMAAIKKCTSGFTFP